MNRDERQRLFIDKFRSKKGVGTLLAATGFGKTFVALLLISDILKNKPESTFLIVVPTENLKEQWELKIQQWNLNNCTVQVVNTACNNIKSYTLVVLDEVHMYGGNVFSKVFKIKREFILGLTATIDPYSSVDMTIKQYCPVIDRITMEECRVNGWVADFEVYNLKVELTPDELTKYNKAEYLFRKMERALGGRFDAFDNANQWINGDDVERKKIGFLYINSMQKRRTILQNAENKVKITKEIINKFPDKKALIFSEGILMASEIKKQLGKSCLIYHSKLNSHEKKNVLNLFSTSDQVKVISSVRALNAGLDVPDCSLGIATSGNSKEIDDLQRTGRVVRKDGDKKALFINLYIPNTQDEVWLNKRQKSVIPKIVSSLQEIPLF